MVRNKNDEKLKNVRNKFINLIKNEKDEKLKEALIEIFEILFSHFLPGKNRSRLKF